MFIPAMLSLFVAIVASILGFTVLTDAAVATAQLTLVVAWIAFMIFAMMGRREPAPDAYRQSGFDRGAVSQPSVRRAGQRRVPD